MPRLPSIQRLLFMTKNDRDFTLVGHYQDLKEEIEGQSGYIMPWNGATKSGLLRSSRQRLRRMTRTAKELGVELFDKEDKAA